MIFVLKPLSGYTFRGLSRFFKSNFGFASLSITFLAFLLFSPLLLFIDKVYNIAEKIAELSLILNAGRFIYVFLFYFILYFIFTVPVFLNGLSVSGYIISYFYTAVLGTTVGIYNGYFYSEFSGKGFLHCVAVVFPSMLIYIIAYILATSESYVFSRMLCKAFLPDQKYNFRSDFKIYCLRFVFVFCLVVVAALIFALCTHFIKII